MKKDLLIASLPRQRFGPKANFVPPVARSLATDEETSWPELQP